MRDPRYILFVSLLLFTFISSIILFLEYYNVYLWGTKAEIIVFTSSECVLCEKFVEFVENLGSEGFNVNVCDISLDPGCEIFIEFFAESEMPIILPISIVIKDSHIRGILVGDWYGLPFWYMLRDTDIGNYTIIPVYKRGEIFGMIKTDDCFHKEFINSLINKNYTMFRESCLSKKNPYVFVSLP